jgi:hypothetical protein
MSGHLIGGTEDNHERIFKIADLMTAILTWDPESIMQEWHLLDSYARFWMKANINNNSVIILKRKTLCF